MKESIPDLSMAQWEFLAVLHEFRLGVSLDLIGKICPLPPAEFVALQEIAFGLKWIEKTKDNIYTISNKIPPEVEDKLKKVEVARLIDETISKLAPETLIVPVDLAAIAGFLHRHDLPQPAARMESDLARYYIGIGRYNRAMEYLERSVSALTPLKKDEKCNNLYVENVLKLLNLTFALGKGFDKLPALMQLTEEAIGCAEECGNKRLLAMAHLHLGRLQLFAEHRTEALNNLAIGRKEIEELGDEDSRSQAAEFIGLFYYIQGNFFQAIEYLEEAGRDLGSGRKDVIDPCSCSLLGYSAAYIGQLSLAIGSLDCHWRIACGKENNTAASTIRATMGTVLLLIGNNREGYMHLQEAVKEAERTKNSLALYFGRAGLALYHFLGKRYQEAYDIISLNLCKGIDSGKGMLSLLSSPWVLEMICEAMLRGIEISIPGFDFQEALQKIVNSPNVHMKGVALRIEAQLAAANGEKSSRILAVLDESENHLVESGDRVQLAKTCIEKVRLYIRGDKMDEARELAYRAREGLSGYSEDSFPDDLRYLLKEYDPADEKNISNHSSLRLFLDMMDELVPSPQFDNILTRMVGSANRLFGGERGGLFWFEKEKGDPFLRASHNMTKSDITGNGFRTNLSMIRKSFKAKQPVVARIDNKKNGFKTAQSVLCIPFKTRTNEGGVLYHDNSYLDGCFNLFERSQLEQLSNHLAAFVERLTAQQEARNNRKALALEYTSPNRRQAESGIIYQSPAMNKLLEQADRVAGTDASVLILGETGVGKGMLAHWIHERSLRREKPLVIVDLTTVPENLVESELFGYEKGAFTGADSQKIGRLELADRGALFIDEIGEISRPVQAKLLRVIQEKAFVRIGGTRTLKSDFRLIVATNRNLPDEMITGAFRSDLLFRINTITLTIPPLRERKDDILPLARHFFSYFTNKHKRNGLTIGKAEENRLLAYHWPGNVRELKHLIESSVLLSTGDRLEINLPLKSGFNKQNPFSQRPPLDELQKQYIEYILSETKGQIGGPGGAAEILGIRRTTLNARMKKLKISPESFRS